MPMVTESLELLRVTAVQPLVADGTVTARIRSTVELNDAGRMLEKLRYGGLGGKAVIRLERRARDTSSFCEVSR